MLVRRFQLEGEAGRDMVDVIGVDAGLLDGLAEQAVQNDGVVFELPQGAAQPRRQLELWKFSYAVSAAPTSPLVTASSIRFSAA